MDYILLIVLTVLSSDKEPKEIELRLPYSSRVECLKAERKIDFSFKFPGKELKTTSKCILKNEDMREENVEI